MSSAEQTMAEHFGCSPGPWFEVHDQAMRLCTSSAHAQSLHDGAHCEFVTDLATTLRDAGLLCDQEVVDRVQALTSEWDATAARLEAGSGEDFVVVEVLSACASKVRSALNGGAA